MFRVCLIADKSEQVEELSARLAEKGFLCSIASGEHGTMEMVTKQTVDLVLVALNGSLSGSEMQLLPQRIRQETDLPVITLISRHNLSTLDRGPDVDDFVLEPWDTDEVAARAKRIIERRNNSTTDGGELIKCGDLTIDLARCEVYVGSRLVELTFKEYELLRFLVSNKGRVFTREVLLNKVWGYDYYGGDRTVDVHIRRLRSKLGDSDYIDTVRNIGYRSRDDL